MKKRIILPALILFCTTIVFGQTKQANQQDQHPAKSYFKSSLSYLSNAVYQGRKDSAVISYITPAISYVNKSGWNLTGSLSYSPNPGINEIQLFAVETGYDHKFSPSISANLYAAAYFYNQFSSAVQAETNGGVGIGLNYSPKDIFNLSLDGGMTVAKSPDIATTVSLGKPFYMGSEARSWSIVPEASMKTGTQGYYTSYYTDKKFNQTIRTRQKGRGRGSSGSTTTTEKTVNVTSAKTFKVLDYELSVPVSYEATKWGAFLTPIYAIPVNPLSYTEAGSTTPITETLSNSFYFTIGAYFKF